MSISHVFREANACADMLTHLGVENDHIYIFQDPPAGLSPLLLADAMGVTFIH